jgi:hypothetical protein
MAHSMCCIQCTTSSWHSQQLVPSLWYKWYTSGGKSFKQRPRLKPLPCSTIPEEMALWASSSENATQLEQAHAGAGLLLFPCPRLLQPPSSFSCYCSEPSDAYTLLRSPPGLQFSNLWHCDDHWGDGGLIPALGLLRTRQFSGLLQATRSVLRQVYAHRINTLQALVDLCICVYAGKRCCSVASVVTTSWLHPTACFGSSTCLCWSIWLYPFSFTVADMM